MSNKKPLSTYLKSHGWVAGFPNYDIKTWVNFIIKYFGFVPWHREAKLKVKNDFNSTQS